MHHTVFQPHFNVVIIATALSATILWVLWRHTDSFYCMLSVKIFTSFLTYCELLFLNKLDFYLTKLCANGSSVWCTVKETFHCHWYDDDILIILQNFPWKMVCAWEKEAVLIKLFQISHLIFTLIFTSTGVAMANHTSTILNAVHCCNLQYVLLY